MVVSLLFTTAAHAQTLDLPSSVSVETRSIDMIRLTTTAKSVKWAIKPMPEKGPKPLVIFGPYPSADGKGGLDFIVSPRVDGTYYLIVAAVDGEGRPLLAVCEIIASAAPGPAPPPGPKPPDPPPVDPVDAALFKALADGLRAEGNAPTGSGPRETRRTWQPTSPGSRSPTPMRRPPSSTPR